MFGRDKSSDTDTPRRRTASAEDTSPPQTLGTQYRRGQTLSQLRRDSSEGAAVSHRHRLHHLTGRRRKAGGLLLLVLAIIGLLVFLIFQLTATVSVVGSSSDISKQPDVAAYTQRINDYYSIHPFERLRFALDQDNLSRFMAAGYPEVARVELTNVENIIDSQFTMTFREPLVGWQINNRQYYVDDQGVVFENNYFTTPVVQMIDESGISPEEGSAVASTRLLSFVGTVVARAGEQGLTVESVSLPAGLTRQVDVRVKGHKPYIRMTIDREAQGQVTDMVTALAFMKDEKLKPRYIDVRVEGRAAYR